MKIPHCCTRGLVAWLMTLTLRLKNPIDRESSYHYLSVNWKGHGCSHIVYTTDHFTNKLLPETADHI